MITGEWEKKKWIFSFSIKPKTIQFSVEVLSKTERFMTNSDFFPCKIIFIVFFKESNERSGAKTYTNKSSCQTGSHDMVSVTLATFYTIFFSLSLSLSFQTKIRWWTKKKYAHAIWLHSVSVKHETPIQNRKRKCASQRVSEWTSEMERDKSV